MQEEYNLLTLNFGFNINFDLKLNLQKTSFSSNIMMSFLSQNSSNAYKVLIHSNLMIATYQQNRISFTFFDLSHQDIIKHTQLFNSDLTQTNMFKYGQPIVEVFAQIQKSPEQSISFSKLSMTLKISLPKKEKPLIFDLTLKENQLESNETISFLKDYAKCQEIFYKSEILRLKSKIYLLMTQVDDATNLIRSQSLQAKTSKAQIKSLKKQLQLLQDQKKKQQETTFTEVGVQHSYSTQFNDIIECLERPELRQFTFDEEKLRNLTRFLQRQIKENEKILFLGGENLGINQHEKRRYFSADAIRFQASHVSLSPQKVHLIKKPSDRFVMQNLHPKTLESV